MTRHSNTQAPADASADSHPKRALPTPPPGPEGVDDATWMDVIHKMDEVYTKLIADEVELEQKNAELEQSHQFIFSVLSAMSDLVIACSDQGDIEEINGALAELVGRSDDQLIGTSVYGLLADAHDATLARQMTARAAAGRERPGETVELHLRDRGGQAVPVEVQCTPRFDRSGQRAGFVLVGRPVGELRRAYEQLQEAHAALKRTQQQLLHSEKMASLGRLVAGVAHELNNPISFILGNVHAVERYCKRLSEYIEAVHAGTCGTELQTLREQLKIDRILADFPSLIEGTLEGAQRTAEIVNGLKRFSAVDREEAKPVDLNAVIERAIHWVRKGAKRELAVQWQPQPGLQVLGSSGQLLQVFMNLIQNAYDATALSSRGEPRLSIGAQRSADRIVLRFRDNGPGIAAAILPRIFDPFFTTKPVGQGTGLGLSISYGIVEQHGGQLRAEDTGEGAEFVVELPALGGEGRP
jgi:two-component system sensor histidine kinase HupT/HoxJ